MCKITDEVKAALKHVRLHHPEVTQVFYGVDCRWLFCGEAFEAPTFGSEIDVGLLEDAADSLNEFPCAFSIFGKGY